MLSNYKYLKYFILNIKYFYKRGSLINFSEFLVLYQ